MNWLKTNWVSILSIIIFGVGMTVFIIAIKAADITVTVGGCFVNSIW